MTMSTARSSSPMNELNMTPLIDVLLVLLVMFIITIPVATHTITIDLPRCQGECITVDTIKNKITIETDSTLRWNGRPVTETDLHGLLARSMAYAVEPELQFEPAGNASYAQSARVINLIRNAGVTKFGFVGNDRYRAFDAG